MLNFMFTNCKCFSEHGYGTKREKLQDDQTLKIFVLMPATLQLMHGGIFDKFDKWLTVYWEIFEVQHFRGQLVILKFFVNKFSRMAI